jgi:hypothetical protein
MGYIASWLLLLPAVVYYAAVPKSTSFQILKHKETVDSLLENMGPEGFERKTFTR